MNSTGRPLADRIDRWLAVAALASVVLLAAAASTRCVWQTDFWWQYATGRYVAAHGPPRVDPYSFGEPGREWVEPRWLYCLGLAETCDRFGVGAAVVAAALASIGAFAPVALAAPAGRRAPPAIAAAVLTLAVLTARPRLTVRPEIVSYVGLALVYGIIERYRSRGGGRILLALPLVQVVWVNAHTLFVLGPVLVGAFFAASLVGWLVAAGAEARADRLRTARAAGLALVATALACLASPYGPRVVPFTIRLLTEVRGTAFKEFIQELESPFTYHGLFLSIGAYKALIVAGALSIVANARRLDLFRALVWGAMLYVSALAVRNIALFAFVAVPFTIDNFGRSGWWEGRPVRPIARALAIAVVGANVLAVWAFATDRYSVRQFETNQFGVGVAEHRYPAAAADFMQEHHISGPVFSTMHESAYLIFRGERVFFDPRIEVYTEAHFSRFVDLISGGGDWDAAVREFGMRAALVDNTFLGFVRQLAAAPDWRLVYFDECAVLFVRGEAAASESAATASPSPPPIVSDEDFAAAIARVRARLSAPVPYERAPLLARVTSPTPYHRVANVLITLGRIGDAEPFLRDAVAAYPGASGARVSLAQILESRGDAAAAGREYETAYRWAPNDPAALVALGRFRAVSGRPTEAMPLLERALARDPDNALAWALTGEIAAGAGRLDDAERRLARAAALDPSNAMVAERLAEVRRTRGR